ncbi:MAG: ABC transporter permease subunit [Spirochaetaceae bacterium]|nr:ABC transporter permease subunit [Spirochaetaceae bacterium]
MSILQLLDQYGERYLLALLTTWRLTAVSFIVAFAAGIFVTVLRISPIRLLRGTANIYIQLLRNIPGVALLIVLVYALPYLDIVFSYTTCVLIATSLIPSAFCSEYLIAGINTIKPGQIEAARALGFPFFKIIRHIILPQALRASVLPLTNLLIATMLTTAIASQVPMNPQDLTGIVDYINTHDTGGIAAFVISALLYCATAIVIGQVGNAIDKKVRIIR